MYILEWGNKLVGGGQLNLRSFHLRMNESSPELSKKGKGCWWSWVRGRTSLSLDLLDPKPKLSEIVLLPLNRNNKVNYARIHWTGKLSTVLTWTWLLIILSLLYERVNFGTRKLMETIAFIRKRKVKVLKLSFWFISNIQHSKQKIKILQY